MKKLILGILVLAASVVNAAEVVVTESTIPYSRGRTFVESRFFMDTKTGEGFVKVSVNEEIFDYYNPGGWCNYDPYGRCYPGPHTSQRRIVQIFSDKVKVEGLMLMGDQAVYQGAEGNVVCGTMGVSRVFKVPTLYLTGNCKLSGVIRREGRDNKVQVKLITK